MKARGVTFKQWVILNVLAVALVLGFGLWGMMSPTAQAIGEPQPGTMQRAVTHTLVDDELLIATTTYSDAPLAVGTSLDVSRITDWHSADVFVTADISGTATLTATVQVSADQVNWADADYVYATSTADISAAADVSGTVTLTATGTSALTTQAHQIVLSADGTDYLRVPLAGEYMRVKLEASSIATNTVTAPVQATLRND